MKFRSAAALLTVLLSACGAPSHTYSIAVHGDDGMWTQYERDASHNAIIEDGLAHPGWAVDLGAETNGTLSYTAGTIYVGTFGKRVLAVDATNGAIKWATPVDDVVMSPPVLFHHLVIVGTGTNAYQMGAAFRSFSRPAGNSIYALDAKTGRTRWRFKTEGEDMPGGVIAGGRYIFANGDGHVYALDPDSGKQLWRNDFGYVTMSSAASDGDLVYIGYCGTPYCGTAAVLPQTGQILWKAHAGGTDCSPAVSNGLIFVNAIKARNKAFAVGGTIGVDALRANDGSFAWSWRGESAPTSAVASGEYQIAGTVANGVLYQSISNNNVVIAFDATTGRQLWSVHTLGNVKMNPIARDKYLYFGDIAGILYVVDRTNGTIVWTQTYQFPFSVAAPMIVNTTLYIANGKALYAIPISSLSPKAGFR